MIDGRFLGLFLLKRGFYKGQTLVLNCCFIAADNVRIFNDRRLIFLVYPNFSKDKILVRIIFQCRLFSPDFRPESGVRIIHTRVLYSSIYGILSLLRCIKTMTSRHGSADE